MNGNFRIVAAVGGLLIGLATADPALAQKPGGVLKLSHFDSPASMSILEESTRAASQPMMGVFNNLVVYASTSPNRASRRCGRIWRRAGAGAKTAKS
jgi:hypothetical protein